MREIFNQLNGFDEDYFMYGEDLDICLRIKKSGYRNYYYPGTSILHFKGQSSKTRRFRTFVDFYMAMFIFVKKHHNYHMPTFIIALGIFFAALIGVFSRLVPQWWKMLVDVAIMQFGPKNTSSPMYMSNESNQEKNRCLSSNCILSLLVRL